MLTPPVVSVAQKLPLPPIVVNVSIIRSQDGAYVVYIYPNGAANIDKRLQLFDKIIEVEGKKITADMSYTDLKKVFKRRYLVVSMLRAFHVWKRRDLNKTGLLHSHPQVKLTVNRFEPPPINEIDIEIAKKAGKEIGFNFIECQDHGILVTDIVSVASVACERVSV